MLWKLGDWIDSEFKWKFGKYWHRVHNFGCCLKSLDWALRTIFKNPNKIPYWSFVWGALKRTFGPYPLNK